MKKTNSFRIEPLSKKTLNDAVKLVVDLFGSKPADFDFPRKWMPASLNSKSKKNKKIYASYKCTYLKYYVAIEDEKVVGTTGIYTLEDDENDSAWIAWYCVDPKKQGRGYGSKLLDFTINLAKKKGKKFLKLYTSYNTDIKKAMNLYEKRGFKFLKKEINSDTHEEIIYLSLNLRKNNN